MVGSSSETISLSLVVRNCKILQNCHGRTGSLGRVLKYTTDSAVTDIIFLTGNIHSIHQDLSGIHRYAAANDVQHGCLSGTIASDNGNKLAILNFQVKIFKQADLVDRTRIIHFVNML